MLNITRRSFMGGMAAIPFWFWFEKYAAADTTPMVRHDVMSTEGQQMLRTYAQAVKTMSATAATDPRSWVFQWYTHAVKDTTDKQSEIARIFGSGSQPARSLAGDMWDTCQAHGEGEDENFFLPWHRMYVFFLERIVRSVSGDKSFTLPYWNYSDPNPATHGILPAQFRTQSDPVYAILYRRSRNSSANAGRAIDRGAPGSLDLSALSESSYEPVGAAQGFCQALDMGLHGSVHVEVGNTQGMGSVPWAANDPIFWLHHCNIDRLWESWNKNGGVNPGGSWNSGQFVFADENGNKVTGTIKDFLDISTLGYSYERLEPAPANFAPRRLGAAPPTLMRLAEQAGPAVALGTQPVRVVMQPPKSMTGTPPSISQRLSVLPPQKHLYLVLKDLRAAAQPGVMYAVYLDLPPNASPAQGRAHRVGTINFFEAVPHMRHTGMTSANAQPKFYGLMITPNARRLQSQGMLSESTSITIAPVGTPAARAKPVIGDISIVEQ
jgi:tyrosinase